MFVEETPSLWQMKIPSLTCLLVHRQVDSTVAARAELLLEKVNVFNVATTRLNEPGTV